MKILSQKVKPLSLSCTIEDNLKNCAIVTRLSRQVDSTEKTDDDNKRLIQSLIKDHHYEPLEFCNLYIDTHKPAPMAEFNQCVEYLINTHTSNPKDAHVRLFMNGSVLVATLREFAEFWESKNLVLTVEDIIDNMKVAGLDEHHFKGLISSGKIDPRYVMLTISNRQIQTEISRHRAFSKNWESTRWCKYSNPKFDKNLRFVCNELAARSSKEDGYGVEHEINDFVYKNSTWEDSYTAYLCDAEKAYLGMSAVDGVPNYIPAFLLNSALKAEVAYCAFGSEFEVLKLKRLTDYCGNPHVYAKDLVKQMIDVYSSLKKSFDLTPEELTISQLKAEIAELKKQLEETKAHNDQKSWEAKLKKQLEETAEDSKKAWEAFNRACECGKSRTLADAVETDSQKSNNPKQEDNDDTLDWLKGLDILDDCKTCPKPKGKRDCIGCMLKKCFDPNSIIFTKLK